MHTVGRGDPMEKRRPSLFARFLAVLLATILLLGVAVYGGLYILLEGPSHYAGGLFAAAVADTPVGDAVLHLFLTDAEIAAYQSAEDNHGEQLFSVYP